MFAEKRYQNRLRDQRFGVEENGMFFTLVGCDIFVQLKNIRVLLSAELQKIICIASAQKKGFVKEQMPAAEESLGRTPALLVEGHRVPGLDADHTRKHLEPSPLAAIIQSESSSSAPDCDSRCPGRLPEPLTASLVL